MASVFKYVVFLKAKMLIDLIFIFENYLPSGLVLLWRELTLRTLAVL